MRLARVIDKEGRTLCAAEQPDGTLLRVEGDPTQDACNVGEEIVEPQAWLPVVEPRAIMCIGLNYREHIEEGKAEVPEYPVLFMKNPNAANGHMQPIVLPKVCKEEVDFEGELAIIIGWPARDVPKDKALDYVLGYTAANDVSARIWQLHLGGSQWNRGKGFDTFAPMGPVMVTRDELGDASGLGMRTELNGEVMQDSHTANMIFDVATLVSFLSQDTTLLPGTVILTGTPRGVGWVRKPRVTLQPGDTISVEIEGIGKLSNPVKAAE